MPKNKVQFQRGMGLREFMDKYGTAEQCEQALFAWRWPRGFVCPECGHTAYCVLKGRRLIQCNGCRRQTSVTAGTLFAGSKLPLSVWFLAMHLITQAKNGISSLELSRQLAISQNSAWLMKHKLMQAMLERDAGRKLRGLVQIDDAYWGGRRRGYKRGRGTRGKALVLPPMVPHSARAITQVYVIDVFHPAREDFKAMAEGTKGPRPYEK